MTDLPDVLDPFNGDDEDGADRRRHGAPRIEDPHYCTPRWLTEAVQCLLAEQRRQRDPEGTGTQFPPPW